MFHNIFCKKNDQMKHEKTFFYEIQISENNCIFIEIYVNDDSVELFTIVKSLSEKK